MRELGVRSLAVTRELCHHEAMLSADRWSDGVLVRAFRPRMVCTRCGNHRGRREAELAGDEGERELTEFCNGGAAHPQSRARCVTATSSCLPPIKRQGSCQVKKKIISLLAAAMMIPATLTTATNSSAQRQASATEPLSAGGPPAPNSPPTYPRPGIPSSPIPPARRIIR